MNDSSTKIENGDDDGHGKHNANMDSLDIESPAANAAPVSKQELTVSQETPSSPPPSGNCCATMWHYGGIPEAKGYALLAMGRGAAVMSNIVVNAALLELALDAAGCPTGEDLKAMEAEGTIDSAADYECTGTVYGQNPLSLISNIAVVTGLLGAFFMPMIGVILDFTPYRRFVGILISVIFTMIQAVQIGIGPKTWFPMAILMTLAGFCYTIMILTAFAYLPEICEKAGQQEHAQYTARFTAKQFTTQASFLILMGALSFGLGISDNSVKTARLSQALNVGIISILFGLGWHYMPSRKARREIPQGKRCFGILIYGIRQNVRTAISIHREYKKGLRWYLLATMFAQSSVGALTTVSVVYLSSEVGLNATDISLFFLVVLISTIPGTKISSKLSKVIDPNTSWQLSMVCLFSTMVIGAFTLGDAENKYMSLIWGFSVGIVLGWFYPTENLFFSCILPKGQEAEIAGFRVYCSMILSWLPPLIFSVLVENGVDAKWGMTFMGSFVLVAALMLKFGAGTWEEILQESGRSELAEHDTTEESPLQNNIVEE
mmetsp:Transcript_20149/g.43767  ORF Transcript_20149/g.43767 Transcript_20149/m.43767 type:complete len:548 (-) Transcript_20149:358-2001(-)